MAENKIEDPGTAVPGFLIRCRSFTGSGPQLSFLPARSKKFMQPALQYINQGRGGSVIYSDAVSAIRFYFEFGGGDCVAIIFIPADKNWVKETGRTLAEKATIIQFVSAQATHDQVSNGRYSITNDFIEIYRN